MTELNKTLADNVVIDTPPVQAKQPTRDEKIAMLMNMLMTLMDTCRDEKINFSSLYSAGSSLWSVRNNVSDLWDFDWTTGTKKNYDRDEVKVNA